MCTGIPARSSRMIPTWECFDVNSYENNTITIVSTSRMRFKTATSALACFLLAVSSILRGRFLFRGSILWLDPLRSFCPSLLLLLSSQSSLWVARPRFWPFDAGIRGSLQFLPIWFGLSSSDLGFLLAGPLQICSVLLFWPLLCLPTMREVLCPFFRE